MSHRKRLAILVAGGPAPGINAVIGAATIRSVLDGVEVLGIQDGFEWIMKGNIDHVRILTIDDVSRIHFRGGSHIGISRANPTVDPALIETSITSLLRLNVDRLITIGGDDTASAETTRRSPRCGSSSRPAVVSTSCTCRRRSTTTSTCPRTSTRSASRPRVTSASSWSRTSWSTARPPHELAKFAATAGLTLDEFRREFGALIECEPPPLEIVPKQS